jgi:hypothetical protein
MITVCLCPDTSIPPRGRVSTASGSALIPWMRWATASHREAQTLTGSLESLWRVTRRAFLRRDTERAKVRCRNRYRNHRERPSLVLTIEWCGRAHVETARCGVAWHVEPESDMVRIYRRQYNSPIRVFVAIKTKKSGQERSIAKVF